MAGQVRPAHRAGHGDVREKQPNVRFGFEELQGLVGISGIEHPVSRIQEHVGCTHPLEDVVFDHQNYSLGGAIGH